MAEDRDTSKRRVAGNRNSSEDPPGEQLFDRRDVLRYGLAFGAGLSGLEALSACGSSSSSSSTSGAAKAGASTTKITMKLGSDSPIDVPHTAAVVTMKQQIEAKTNGRIQCVIFPNGSLGDNGVMLDSIKAGTLDGMLCDLAVPSVAVPDVNVFSLPFLFTDAKQALRAAQGQVGNTIKPKLESAYNCEVLGWGSDGDVHNLLKPHPITTPDSFHGLKIRTQASSIQTDAYKAFGALPSVIAFTELYTALQTGVVDGAGIAPTDMIGSKFYEVGKYYTLDSIFNNTQFVTVSKKFMSKLSAADQELVRAAGAAGGAANAKATFNVQSTDINTLKTKGIAVNTPTDRAAFVSIAQPVWEKNASQAGGTALIQQAHNTP